MHRSATAGAFCNEERMAPHVEGPFKLLALPVRPGSHSFLLSSRRVPFRVLLLHELSIFGIAVDSLLLYSHANHLPWLGQIVERARVRSESQLTWLCIADI